MVNRVLSRHGSKILNPEEREIKGVALVARNKDSFNIICLRNLAHLICP